MRKFTVEETESGPECILLTDDPVPRMLHALGSHYFSGRTPDARDRVPKRVRAPHGETWKITKHGTTDQVPRAAKGALPQFVYDAHLKEFRREGPSIYVRGVAVMLDL